MRKTIIAAAFLAATSSVAFAQTTAPTTGMNSGMNSGTPTNGAMVNEGAASTSGTMDASGMKSNKQTGKHMKSATKKSDKSNMSTGSSGSMGTTGGVTGATGTTAAGTAGQATSGATKPAGDASMTK